MSDGKILVGVSYFNNREPVDNYSDADMVTVAVLDDSELSGQLFTVAILDNSLKPSWVPAKRNLGLLRITVKELSEFTDIDIESEFIDGNTDTESESESWGAAAASTFNEEDHPRADDGKFGDGNGNGDSGVKKNDKPINKIREELKDVAFNTADSFFFAYDAGTEYNPKTPEIDADTFNQKYKGQLDIIATPGSHSPIDIVLSDDDTFISPDSLDTYNNILQDAISQSPSLQKFQQKIKEGNKTISDELERTNTVKRGADITELTSMLENDGKVGYHSREQYGKYTDFVSTSIDSDQAKEFSTANAGPIEIEFDVSQMDKADYQPVQYELRRDIKIKDDNREFRPYEKFGGVHSSTYMREGEVHLRKGSKPTVKSVNISYPTTPEEKKEIENTVSRLGDINNQKIEIKYNNG